MAGQKRGLGLGLRRGSLLDRHTPVCGRTRLPHFITHGGTPEENIAAFVKQARDNPCWLEHINFDEDCWDVTGSVAQRLGRPIRACAQRLWFCPARKTRGPNIQLPSYVKDFCKAIVRQTRGVRLDVLRSRIEACRYLGNALEAERCGSISECSIAVLDAAADLARSRLGQESAHGVACQIRIVVRFLDKHRMTLAPVGNWSPAKHGSVLPTDSDAKTERARNRLPANGYIAALGEAFQLAVLDTDVIITCVLVLQCCGLGWRIDDVLNLPEDCREGLDAAGTLALRCIGSKGVGPVVRDVPATMTALARSALARIHHLTRSARAAKRWYDKHPTELYLPESLAHLRAKSWLTIDDAGALIGLSRRQVRRYVRRSGMEMRPIQGSKRGRSFEVRFASLQRHYLEQLPKRLWMAGGRNHHPLLLVQQGLFKRPSSRSGSPCMFETVSYQHICLALMPQCGAPGMFRRLGISCGQSGRNCTHAIRHFFATLALGRGVSGDDLAHVQGRTDLRHNAHYEHFPDELGHALLARVAADLALENASSDIAVPPRDSLPDAAGMDAMAAALMQAQKLPRTRAVDRADTSPVT